MLEHPHLLVAVRGTAGRALLLVLAAVLALVTALVPVRALADPSAEPSVPETAYRALGAPVEGGSSLAQAPTVGPGLHRDSLPQGAQGDAGAGTGSTLYYRIAVAEGERVHAAATIAAPPYEQGIPEERERLGVDLSFLDASGGTCNGGGTTTVGEAYTGDGPITEVRVSEPMGPEDCSGTELFIQVTRTGPRLAEAPLPLELQLAVEPAGTEQGRPAIAEPLEDGGASPVAPKESEPIEPGRSLGGAVPVQPGSVVVKLAPGEVGFVSVPVGQGQRLRWRTEIVSEVGTEAGQLAVLVQNPVRDLVTVGAGIQSLSQRGAIDGGGMAAPVAVGNRDSESAAIRSAWLPGTHTVMVQRLQRPEGADPAGAEPVRLILTLEVEGEAGPAADVLDLGDLPAAEGRSWGGLGGSGGPQLGTVAMLVGAAVLALIALITGIIGAALLLARPQR